MTRVYLNCRACGNPCQMPRPVLRLFVRHYKRDSVWIGDCCWNRPIPTTNDQLRATALLLVEDVETFARVFGFVVPATASKVRALLAGRAVHEWRKFRDPNDSTQVY